MDDKYDEFTQHNLALAGLPSLRSAVRPRTTNEPLPYNTAGLPALRVYDMPFLEGTNTLGFVLASNRLAQEQANRGAQQNIFVSPSANAATIAHEAEHLIARQMLGHPAKVRDKFIELLADDPRQQNQYVSSFLNGIIKSAPYLKKTYGIDNAYFDPDFIWKQGRVGLYEILASLAGTEVAKHVDLTKDPELRKTMFKDPAIREAYNAVTGLRQTRLDPRDIAPYTRVPEPKEKAQSLLEKTKKSLGFNGGGRTRLI